MNEQPSNRSHDHDQTGAHDIPAPPLAPPTKVCPKCSVQTHTSGDFCPHCGARYVRRRRPELGRKAIIGIVAAAVVLLGIGGGIVWKVQHDREQERNAEAAALEAERETAAREREEKAEAEREAAEEAAALETAERAVRTSIIKQMQQSITKDAKEKVSEGVLEGPIYYTNCDPLGGGSVDDLTALTTTFECLAVNEKLDGGQVRGWVFSSTVNWDEGSWSWHLGR
ncbi:DUF2510 domain-containing protein [Nocardioides sp. dk4132]|uniref:DUF2510 domain-containing protein n=1 Tax=unclassified Nocardioides TaxID=2615069 RepID=UPI001296748F|nr:MULTISPECIES: DUF2510 domain-containing protein [unclassified Nocardioides]MQW75307.1 DUF2510 domain-containing protein [Nocardioides sp. dk4132]QGA07543.1 DUF2510 domain-containing protein [Nocardioides sp. dk884]